MNDARLKRVRDDLSALLAKRRLEHERRKPCPACQRVPDHEGDMPMIAWINEDTGLDTATGEPPCDVCEARAAHLYGDNVITRIEFVPLEDPDYYDPLAA